MLALAMGTGYFPGFALGVLAPTLTAELGFSRFAIGSLTTVFFVLGGLGSVAAGRTVDAIGARRVMVGAFLVLTAAIVGFAASPSYPWLALSAALAGTALATGNPVTNVLVAEHVAPRRRGLVMGVKQAGVQFGAFLAGGLLAPAAAGIGWRTALLVSAAVPLLGALGAMLVVPPDDRATGRGDRGAREPASSPIRRLAVYGFLMGVGVSAVNAYLPLFAVEGAGFSPVRAGAIVALVGGVGMVMRVVWGWLSDRGGRYRELLVWLGAGGALSIAVALAVLLEEVPAALLWLAAVGLGVTAVTWTAPAMLAVLKVSRPGNAGHASGVVLLGFYLGFVPSPMVFGALVDATGTYVLSWSLVLLAFVAAAASVLPRASLAGDGGPGSPGLRSAPPRR